jgi:cysteine synthase
MEAEAVLPGGVKGSVLDLVGNTPLVKINKVTDGVLPGVDIYAKLEGYNPGG